MKPALEQTLTDSVYMAQDKDIPVWCKIHFQWEN